jgi:hypothetical protein
MSDFPECLLVVTAEVDAAVEAECNRSTRRFTSWTVAPYVRSRTQVIVPVHGQTG